MTDHLMLAMAGEQFLKPPYARTFSYMFSQEQFAADLAQAKEAHTLHVEEMRKALSQPDWNDEDWEGWYADWLIKTWWTRATTMDAAMSAAKQVDAHIIPQPDEDH